MAATNTFETKFSNRMQVTRYSTPVFSAQASFEERSNLTDGQSVVRPTFARLFADTYTRGSDMTEQYYSQASETLTVNTTPALLLPVDDFDAIQQKTNIQARLAADGMRALNKHIDADYLAEAANATSTVDAGDVGGSAGSGITLDATNILKIFPAVARKLKLLNVDITGIGDPRSEAGNLKPMGTGGFANLNPYVAEQLTYALAGRETIGGDQMGMNGYSKSYFGFDCYDTTNGYWTGTLGIATQPTDGDTVTINGVVFTFKTTLGSTAGNVLIGASAATANTNLAALITTPGTTTAQGVALSTANQRLLARMSSTATATTTPVIAKGYGYVVVSETLTAAADTWSAQISHQLFGQKGAVDMVLQDAVKVSVSDIPKQLGKYIKPRALYGLKTFTEGKDALVDVKISSSSWV